jgi:hypothetical protein
VYRGILNNCTVIRNFAQIHGGGVYSGALSNCISYYNTAPIGPNYDNDNLSTNNYSCTTPLPPGSGNIASEPAFVDLAGGDFRLRSNSPCIDAGTNLDGLLTYDLAGVPCPLDGNGDGVAVLDMGAYEFLLPGADSNGDGIPDDWTWRYGLHPADTNVATSNPDNDAHTTYQEWLAGTDPTDARSCFRIESLALGPPLALSFASLTNRVYSLFVCTNLVQPVWTGVPGQMGIPGLGGRQTLTSSPALPLGFYRVQIQLP